MWANEDKLDYCMMGMLRADLGEKAPKDNDDSSSESSNEEEKDNEEEEDEISGFE